MSRSSKPHMHPALVRSQAARSQNWDADEAQQQGDDVLAPGDLIEPVVHLKTIPGNVVDEYLVLYEISSDEKSRLPKTEGADAPTVEGAVFGIYVGEVRAKSPERNIVQNAKSQHWGRYARIADLREVYDIVMFNGRQYATKHPEHFRKVQ